MARRGRGSFWLGVVFALFVLFLYGPILTILVLSFQGPTGGLTFPMRGFSIHWFGSLLSGLGVVDIWSAFGRSARLGSVPTRRRAVVGDLVLDPLPGAIAGLEDRVSVGVVDRQGDRPVGEVAPSPGHDALGQGQGVVRGGRLVQRDPHFAATLDAHGGLAHHPPRFVAEELGEDPVAVGVPGDLGGPRPLDRHGSPGGRPG